MKDFEFGMLRYFTIGLGVLGVLVGYLAACKRISRFAPRVGAVLGAFVIALAPAIGGAVLAVGFFGERTAIYVLPVMYVWWLVLAIMSALRKQKTGPSDEAGG
jgi:hypothetical protein